MNTKHTFDRYKRATVFFTALLGTCIVQAQGVHLVKAGDTLSSISRAHYGNSKYWSHIADANTITDPTTLKIGQQLNIPEYKSLTYSTFLLSAKNKQVSDTHIVQYGDTLCNIARRRYGDCNLYRNIASHNSIEIESDLEIGQKLLLPTLGAISATLSVEKSIPPTKPLVVQGKPVAAQPTVIVQIEQKSVRASQVVNPLPTTTVINNQPSSQNTTVMKRVVRDNSQDRVAQFQSTSDWYRNYLIQYERKQLEKSNQPTSEQPGTPNNTVILTNGQFYFAPRKKLTVKTAQKKKLLPLGSNVLIDESLFTKTETQP